MSLEGKTNLKNRDRDSATEIETDGFALKATLGGQPDNSIGANS